MILYIREKCKNCENIKRHIKAAKIKNIEEKILSEEAREILIVQGAKTMPLLVKDGQLLAQGNKVIDHLIKLKGEQYIMKIISIINPKGGAGKTVSAVNIAYALKNRGNKVLLIDTDPRGAISTYLNINNENTVLELIKENYENFGMIDISKYIIEKNGVDVIISNSNLIEIDEYFRKEGDIQGQLNSFKELSQHFHQYDYIVVDTEGTINNTIRSILNVTDYIFAPTKVSYIDTNGLRDLLKMVNIGKRNNPKIILEKVFAVQVKTNTKIFKKAHEDLKNDLKELYGNCYSNIYIREDANILNSMEENKDIFSYKKSSNAAIDYKNLIDEFLNERKIRKEEK